ncbi:class II aldolase/adducin family protein [Halobellus ruber]
MTPDRDHKRRRHHARSSTVAVSSVLGSTPSGTTPSRSSSRIAAATAGRSDRDDGGGAAEATREPQVVADARDRVGHGVGRVRTGVGDTERRRKRVPASLDPVEDAPEDVGCDDPVDRPLVDVEAVAERVDDRRAVPLRAGEAVLDADDPREDIGEQVAGELAASSEKPMHLQIMRERDDVGAVVHTHSPYASTFAALHEPIPATHYLIAFAGKEVPVTPYEEPGSEELGAAAVSALGDDHNACLLGNHGVIAVGGDADSAFEVALMVEYCARIHYQGQNIGDPTHLPEEELEHLFDRFSDYGQGG